MWPILAALACSNPEPAAPTPVAEVVAPPVESPAAPAAPKGIIGGEPILPRPVVVGAIAPSAVEGTIAAHRAELDRCYLDERAHDPKLAGKVLVRFTLLKDGHVARATTQSTSLRHAPTEECLNTRIADLLFPALTEGEMAIVSFPFVFPAG